MSRRRKYGEDLTYGEEHRVRLPELYGRLGHRIDLADRDWTEFCHWCKEPLGIYEEVRDVGQDMNDKATTVTRNLARRADVPAFLFGWRVERPAEVDAEIRQLNSRIRELEASYPIVSFRAKQIVPIRGSLVSMTPGEWWEGIYALHRAHHRSCSAYASRGGSPVRADRLEVVVNGSRLQTPEDQLRLEGAA